MLPPGALPLSSPVGNLRSSEMPVFTLPQMLQFIVQFTHLKCCWLKFNLICWDATCDLVEMGERLARWQSSASAITQSSTNWSQGLAEWYLTGLGTVRTSGPWLLNTCIWKCTKANTANILPTLWTLSYHRAETHRLRQPSTEESYFFTHLFLTVLPIFGIIWILLKIKLYLAGTDDSKATTAPVPEALKSVEAPKVQWSMPCPTTSCTHEAHGCSQVCWLWACWSWMENSNY